MPSPYLLQILIGAKNQTKSVFADIGKSIDGLKSGLGKNSTIGELADIFGGRGAVGGLGDAARLLRETTTAYNELSASSLVAGKSAGQFAMDLAKSIPILGDAIRAGAELRAVMDGTAVNAKLAEVAGERNEAVGKYFDKRRGQRQAAETRIDALRDRAYTANSEFENPFDGARDAILRRFRDEVGEVGRAFQLNKVDRAGYEQIIEELRNTLRAEMQRTVRTEMTAANAEFIAGMVALATEQAEFAGELIRQTDENMAQVFSDIENRIRNERVATLQSEEGQLRTALANIGASERAIRERYNTPAPEFLQRGSPDEARLRQRQETALAEARDMSELLKTQRGIEARLAAIQSLLDNVRNQRGAGVIDFTGF